MRWWITYLTYASMAAIALHPPLDACTGLKLTAKNGEVVHGRTLEFGVPIETSVAFIPRDYAFTGKTPRGPGLKYRSKYGVVGTIAYNYPAIMDGINEKGLAIGTFYFPGYASYPQITAENEKKALSPVDFPNWILTQFASLDEVKQGLNSVVIAPTLSQGWGNTPPPFHYIVYDKSGNALVIEPLNGKLVVYGNPMGTFTNSPTFDWHMANLRNYINLSPVNAKPLALNSVELAPFGQGSGLVGMPGDFTPPSRFVRATILSATAVPSNNAEEGVFQAFHILNQFDIPIGAARQVAPGGTIHSDYTLVTTVKDPQALKYYFKTYEDQAVKVVDLKKFNLSGKDLKQTRTNGSEKAKDISATLF